MLVIEQGYIGGKINMQTFQMELGNRTLIIETGKMAKQAGGAVLVR